VSGHSETQGYEARVRASFAKQGFMGTLGRQCAMSLPGSSKLQFVRVLRSRNSMASFTPER
jgi:hypothetical protein